MVPSTKSSYAPEHVHAGNFAHNITTFIVGYAIAFARSWQLSLVMLSVVPALAVAGAVFGTVAGRLGTKAADAYGVANSIVQQVAMMHGVWCRPYSVAWCLGYPPLTDYLRK